MPTRSRSLTRSSVNVSLQPQPIQSTYEERSQSIIIHEDESTERTIKLTNDNFGTNQRTDESNSNPTTQSSSDEDYPAVRTTPSLTSKKRTYPNRKPRSVSSKRFKPIALCEVAEVNPELQSIVQYYRNLDNQSIESIMEVHVVHKIGTLEPG